MPHVEQCLLRTETRPKISIFPGGRTSSRLAGYAGVKLAPSPDKGRRLYVAALVVVALLGFVLLASTRN
jgi:hypothetical protein